MPRHQTFNIHAATGQRATRVVTMIRSQPSWITRAALAAAFFVVSLFILLVVLPAILLAAVVFLALAVVRRGWVSLRDALGMDGSGRRNVRVITPHEQR